jgi:hypothetical protein
MKTPDDFAQLINSRKADSGTVKRKMPASIIITVIFATIGVLATSFGAVQMAVRGLRGDGSFFVFANALGIQLGVAFLAGATLFACIKRPAWGRIISMIFAVSFGLFFGLTLATPDPHPLFPIAPGAEQAGAYAAKAFMILGVLWYIWSMVMGSKARTYFSAP